MVGHALASTVLHGESVQIDSVAAGSIRVRGSVSATSVRSSRRRREAAELVEEVEDEDELVLFGGSLCFRCRHQSQPLAVRMQVDRKSTRLNSSHLGISYAV